MNESKSALENEIISSLKTALSSFDLEQIPEIELTLAPENTGADFSTNLAMRLAKPLKKAPLEIANEIKNILDQALTDNCDVSVAAPGFLNFTASSAYWIETLKNLKIEKLKTYENQLILTEFSDPNPFKVLHVGHLYTSIVGDSISRLLENASANVKRLNFGGDVGLHVAKNLFVLQNHLEDVENLEAKYQDIKSKNEDTSTILSEKAELLGKCYVEGTRAYEDDESAKDEITKLNKLIYKICENGPERNYLDSPEESSPFTPEKTAELAKLYWWGRTASYEYFESFYAKVDLKFDKFYPESTVAELGKQTVLENVPTTYQESDGAIVFKGEDFGLHTRVFINKEGIPTYESKDVGLIFQKDRDFHFDKSIVITGNEQLDYMRVVMKSIEQYAPELIERSTHLTHGMVKLPGAVKMSSRKGNFIRAVDVIDLIKQTLKETYNSDDEKISMGAIKYAFLKNKLGGDIELDVKESVSMTGNSGPYLQYSAVRAKRILEKANQAPAKTVSATDEHETAIIKKLSLYNSVLQDATDSFAPHKLTTYLYELAQEFSRFYEHCPVSGSENEAFRLEIVKKFLETITNGLNLLGIEVPEKM